MVHFPVCYVSLPEGKTVITYLYWLLGMTKQWETDIYDWSCWVLLFGLAVSLQTKLSPSSRLRRIMADPQATHRLWVHGALCAQKKPTAPLREAWLSWMVVSTYPSEEYGSQLGWWNSQYMGNACSKPPTRDGFWKEKALLLEKNHEKPMNHGRKNVQLYSWWPLQKWETSASHSSWESTEPEWYHHIVYRYGSNLGIVWYSII